MLLLKNSPPSLMSPCHTGMMFVQQRCSGTASQLTANQPSLILPWCHPVLLCVLQNPWLICCLNSSIVWYLDFKSSWQGQEHGHNEGYLVCIHWFQGNNQHQGLKFQVHFQLNWTNSLWCLLAKLLLPILIYPCTGTEKFYFHFFLPPFPFLPHPCDPFLPLSMKSMNSSQRLFLISWQFQKLPLKW